MKQKEHKVVVYDLLKEILTTDQLGEWVCNFEEQWAGVNRLYQILHEDYIRCKRKSCLLNGAFCWLNTEQGHKY